MTISLEKMVYVNARETFICRRSNQVFAITPSALLDSSLLFKNLMKLCNDKIDNYAVTELTQGQTRRWVVAWSFGDARVPDVGLIDTLFTPYSSD